MTAAIMGLFGCRTSHSPDAAVAHAPPVPTYVEFYGQGTNGPPIPDPHNTNGFIRRMDAFQAGVSDHLVREVAQLDYRIGGLSPEEKAICSNLSLRIDQLDEFLNDARMNDDNVGTRLSVGLGLKYSREEGVSFVSDVKVRLAIPHMEDRLQLVVNNTMDVFDTTAPNEYLNSLRDSEPQTALRYVFSQTEKRKVNLDVGADFGTPFQIYTRLRGRLTVPWEIWEMQLSDRVSYYTEERFRNDTEMRWSRCFLDRSLIFRSTTGLCWEELKKNVRPSQSFDLIRDVRDVAAHRLTLRATWPESPHTTNANYVVEYGWRRRIHSDYLFLEITPGLEFPQERDYAAQPVGRMLLDFIFGDTPSRRVRIARQRAGLKWRDEEG